MSAAVKSDAMALMETGWRDLDARFAALDEDELDLLRCALDNYAAYEHSQLRDDGMARRLLERIALPKKGPTKVVTSGRTRFTKT